MSYNLYKGCCLEIMPTIPDKSIDMILCDLPYGTTACKWDVIIPFEPLWKEYKRIIKDRGCIALFGSEPFSSYLRMSNIKQFKYDWIWNKSNPANIALSKIQPLKYHEIISIFNSGFYYPQMIKRDKLGTKRLQNKNSTIKFSSSKIQSDKDFKKEYNINKYDEFFKMPSSVLLFKVERGKRHPTQKPVALLEYLIKTYTLENETILDNCMGSGSTGVACVNTNRNFIGIEKEENYFNIAEKRIKEAIENKQELLF